MAPIRTAEPHALTVYYFGIDFSSGFMYFFTMKIEKISENQIKFTLNRSDLASRQIKISELAYGNEKTKDLIQDMMEQASDELDFELNDTPLMIEAIPVSMDCIVLMVTKIDEPEEVDTKFTGFSNLKDLLAENENEGSPVQAPDPQEKGPALTPQQAAQKVNEIFDEHRRRPQRNAVSAAERMFSFVTLDDVIEFARQSGQAFAGESALYASPEDGRYYLILKDVSGDIRSFGRVCNTALEYGRKEAYVPARGSYINEHFRCIIKRNAVGSLFSL